MSGHCIDQSKLLHASVGKVLTGASLIFLRREEQDKRNRYNQRIHRFEIGIMRTGGA